jgi:aspartate/tyrosine/aromatic aminotransferase
MAKATTKPAAAKAPAKKTAAKTKPAAVNIEKTSRDALAKLKSLNIEHQLQADIEWCIGSYHADKNPVGLFDMVNRAITVFKSELEKKTKGVTVKLISDFEKAVAIK